MVRVKNAPEQKPTRLQKAQWIAEYALSPARAFLHELLLFTGAMSGWHPISIAEYEDKLERQEWREKQERLRDLNRRKWIEIRKIGDRLMVRLTARGWQRALRDAIRCSKGVCQAGIVIVIFDVPETERWVRDTLRDILKSCDFEMLQKSVWMSRKDVHEPLCALLQGAKLDRWVRIIVGRELKTSAIGRTKIRLKSWAKQRRRKPR